MTWEEKMEAKKQKYIEEIDTCIKLLETLKYDFVSPGTSTRINTAKVTRIRLTIHDILKKY